MPLKVLIVGGVAGGASAAARLRRLDEEAQVIIFEKGEHISFANCGLPYYIGEIIKEKDKLLVQTPEKMRERFGIDVRVNSEVLKIVPDKKIVEVHDKANNKTYTDVRILSFEERKYELSRMIGGNDITEIMLKNSEEMLIKGSMI
jgi:NADPH-dependent 2,4-dienoyl-CoA reductase/sulfur reductase-like enzyme